MLLMLSVCGEALEVTRQDGQAGGGLTGFMHNDNPIARAITVSAQSGFVVLACIVPKCAAGDPLPVGSGA